jgi:hypothetical protein
MVFIPSLLPINKGIIWRAKWGSIEQKMREI